MILQQLLYLKLKISADDGTKNGRVPGTAVLSGGNTMAQSNFMAANGRQLPRIRDTSLFI